LAIDTDGVFLERRERADPSVASRGVAAMRASTRPAVR
jgi:hypothetical protein